MKKDSPTLSEQIRKQIEERETAPSRDLWSEIQSQAGNSRINRPGINRLLLAACLILTAGLGVILFFNHKTASGMQTAGTESVPAVLVKEKTVAPPQPLTDDRMSMPQPIEKIALQAAPVRQETEPGNPVDEKGILPAAKEISSVAAAPVGDIVPAGIIAQADSVETRKRKKYVDPSTLLFSVEHKDVIEKTKGGSNVATIDLNTK